MSFAPSLGAAVLAAGLFSSLPSLAAQSPQGDPGERLGADAFGPSWVEDMAAVVARQAQMPADQTVHRIWNGQDGTWFVPPMTARTPVKSGSIAVVNRWGDPRMGIGLGGVADVTGVWVAGHGGAPASSVRVIGWRSGAVVQTTRWEQIDGSGVDLQLDLRGVDRIEFQVEPALLAQGWFAIDDLRLRQGAATPERLLDFEDLAPRDVLTGSGYAGLTWEFGTGLRGTDPEATRGVHAPKNPAGPKDAATPVFTGPSSVAANLGTPPFLSDGLDAARQGDVGANLIPPDTHGAAGPDHLVSITNSNLSIYRRSDGVRTIDTSLRSFWNSSASVVGDPRAVFDPHSQRFVLLATDFSGGRTIYLAISQTSDPNGSWFKWSFRTDQGTDAGRWPDFPTLGVDARGIYTAAYMVGRGARMTIWAFDIAPLTAPNPSLGTATAWRSLPWEGAIQPCTTYGDPGIEFLVSRQSSTALRLRTIRGPLTSPALIEAGSVTVPSHGSAPNAPALGSNTPLATIDWRPQNAVFRDGSVWTTQCVDINGKAGVRWYEINTGTRQAVQVGSITDPIYHYFFPTIAVDARGDVAIGFSGSHAGVYAGAFVTGRLASDPAGETAPPVEVQAGQGSWERLDGAGRNRWGDYSHTTVDPLDDLGFWSIQEYAGAPSNSWRTWYQRITYPFVGYGTGLAGTTAEPAIVGTSLPRLGQNLTLDLVSGNGTAPSAGALAIGNATANLALFGGTLLVSPVLNLNVSLGGTPTTLSLPLPNDPALVANSVYLQLLELDSGAPQGVAFSRGMELRSFTR